MRALSFTNRSLNLMIRALSSANDVLQAEGGCPYGRGLSAKQELHCGCDFDASKQLHFAEIIDAFRYVFVLCRLTAQILAYCTHPKYIADALQTL